jgi:hypothetical protein
MESIRASILAGYVPAPGDFGAEDSCRERREALGVRALAQGDPVKVESVAELTPEKAPNRRYYNLLIYRDLLREFKREGVQHRLLQCQLQAGKTSADQVAEMKPQVKTLHREQSRICVLAAMQATVELQLVSEYAYCVWRSAAQKNIEKITQALLKAEAPVPRGLPALAHALPPSATTLASGGGPGR